MAGLLPWRSSPVLPGKLQIKLRIKRFYCGFRAVDDSTISRFDFIDEVGWDPFLWSLRVWLAVEVFGAMYIVSFVWFWQLCRSSARRKITPVRQQPPSNLIPFERGLQQFRNRSNVL